MTPPDSHTPRQANLVVPLYLGCVPDSDLAGPFLIQSENKAFLTFKALKLNASQEYEDAGIAVVELVRFLETHFGYPNDEALSSHPLYANGLYVNGLFEVQHSSWLEAMERQNRLHFPSFNGWRLRHFIVTFHSSTFECIADDLSLTLREESMSQIFERLTHEVSLHVTD